MESRQSHDLEIAGSNPALPIKVCSSIGRATDSKSVGCEFESHLTCPGSQQSKRKFYALNLTSVYPSDKIMSPACGTEIEISNLKNWHLSR